MSQPAPTSECGDETELIWGREDSQQKAEPKTRNLDDRQN